ncbi:hypothetical protein BGZ61DRAFT_119461 [Ilyonectria robusta]|uniref:uncharacterized protein n=1 Tax=Ilyonectria robusta TaxID=1079257 RepID=UPI001E8E9BEC|nr:uncharacterized protein BGZ61DRAFT_119461 [Ilyonectria robusta]KAH8667214.1 hypothetical protein BGZ61DRAFT_119461 [Ilyonectria robusta]
MSEYWKSTPKYWCKHCSTYVRDTKLERQNHEATGKHQGALKRFLRDLHRGHEREEREKEFARREVARVNGVVAGSSEPGSSGPSAPPSGGMQRDRPSAPSESQLKRQREQLAEMGVAMPTEFQPEMAMPGQWTVTKTRVIETTKEENGDGKLESRANGVRKREATEDEKEEEDAVQALFKKPRRWGRDSKAMPQEEDKELDALLSGSTFQPAQVDKREDVKEEATPDDKTNVKVEDDGATEEARDSTAVKGEASEQAPPIKPEADAGESGIAPVVFKKRKPKGIRQK